MITAELHRHLDASFRPETLAELIQKTGAHATIRTAEDVRRDFWLTQPMKSLKEVLDCFVLFQKVLVSEEVLTRMAREACEDAYKEGVRVVEFRYSPSFVSEYSGLDWTKALRAIEKGLAQVPSLDARLICIVSRDYGETMAHQTIEFVIDNRKSFVAVDLAGNELAYPNTMFRAPFKKACDAGLSITVHSGEATGPETVWQAIDELGAQRIGHGIHSIQDPALVQRLIKDDIHLEICPTSNIMTRSAESWSAHPLRRLFDAGVSVSINTDDPGIFGVGLDEETRRAQKHFGFSINEIKQLNNNAHESLFEFSTV